MQWVQISTHVCKRDLQSWNDMASIDLLLVAKIWSIKLLGNEPLMLKRRLTSIFYHNIDTAFEIKLEPAAIFCWKGAVFLRVLCPFQVTGSIFQTKEGDQFVLY